MYSPAQFEQQDARRIAQLIEAFPLATLVMTEPSGRLCADHVPLLLEQDAAHPQGVLRGHVARANPMWRRDGQQVLAVFQGPQAYVSPGWYASKQQHGKVVPTWNYAVVHAEGRLRAVEDAAWLMDLLGRLTRRHEAHRADPWKVEDAPAEFTAQLLEVIVGIEIPVSSITGKWKVSQNRPEADRLGVQTGLQQEGPLGRAMAQLMRDGSVDGR